MEKISIIGSGTVGTIIGKGFIKLGYDVIFYDTDESKLNQLKFDGFDIAQNLNYAIENSDISYIAVPTPSNENGIDLSFIDNATKNCSKSLKNKNNYHIFAIKSTIVPGTTEKVVIPNLEEYSFKEVDKDFGVVYNPEFLTEIAESWTDDNEFHKDFFTEDRIIIGESKNKTAGDRIKNLLKDLKTPIIRTDYKTAEMIKYASNARLAVAISYSNEIFRICEELEIDGQFVANVLALDKRIGKYGSVCGKAFGGKCLPKDLLAFIKFVKTNTNYDSVFLEAIQAVNESMKKIYGIRV